MNARQKAKNLKKMLDFYREKPIIPIIIPDAEYQMEKIGVSELMEIDILRTIDIRKEMAYRMIPFLIEHIETEEHYALVSNKVEVKGYLRILTKK